MLIWPADSGPTYEADEYRVHAYVDRVNFRKMRNSSEVEKYEKEGDEVREIHKVRLDVIVGFRLLK